MKGENGIEINHVLEEHFASNTRPPVQHVAPHKGDDRRADDAAAVATITNGRRLTDDLVGAHMMQPRMKKLGVIALVFVVLATICLGIGLGSMKNGPTTRSSALALQGGDGVGPSVVGGTQLDRDVWQQSRRYLVSIRNISRDGSVVYHICGATLISRRVLLTAAREWTKNK